MSCELLASVKLYLFLFLDVTWIDENMENILYIFDVPIDLVNY